MMRIAYFGQCNNEPVHMMSFDDYNRAWENS